MPRVARNLNMVLEETRAVGRRIVVAGTVLSQTASGALAATTTTTARREMAQPMSGGLESNPALVWRNASEVQSCSVSTVRRVFSAPFVTYLARFLLTYDRGSRLLWRAAGEEIPLSWDESRVRRRRKEQFAEFESSVEAGLCPYAAKCTQSPQLGVRQLLSLLRSRYGQMADGSRQLALLFSLLEPPYQPQDAIAALSAKAQNATVLGVEVVDGGAVAATRREAAEIGLRPPRLPSPALAAYGALGAKAAFFGVPRIEPTGRVLGFVIEDGGCGYENKLPPEVRVAPPSEGRAARAVAVVDNKNGTVVRLDVLDPGSGYLESDAASVEIEPAADASKCGTVAAASPVFEYAVVGIQLLQGDNYGYTTAQSLELNVPEPAKMDGLELARPPKFKVVLAPNVDVQEGFQRGAALWAPRDAASSSLTSLLSPSYGVPIWDGARHRFPAKELGTVRPARFIRRDVALSPSQLAKLALAGALCTSATRAALNPLEVAKTRKQAGRQLQSDEDRWLAVDASAASGAALGACSFAVYELLRRQLPRIAVALAKDPSIPAQYELQLELLACLFAVLVAAAAVAPFEAAKVKIMLDDHHTGNLASALASIAKGDGHARQINPIVNLWASFWPLVARELPFTTAKLVTYSTTQAVLFSLLPAARERPIAALAVSCFSGALAGAAGAALSAPADAVVTELASGKHGDDPLAALAAVLEPRNATACQPEIRRSFGGSGPSELNVLAAANSTHVATHYHGNNNLMEKVLGALPRLFAGVKERMLLFSVIITVQLVLFDFARSLLKVTPDDLSLSIDVFADRLTFYDY